MPDRIKKFKKVLKKCKDVFCGKSNKSNFHEGQSAYGTDEKVGNDMPRYVFDTLSPSESLITSPAANRRLDKLMRKYRSCRSKRTQKNRFQLLKEPGARFRFANRFRRKTRKISKRETSLQELYKFISTSFTRSFFMADFRQFEDFTSNSTWSKRRVVHSYGFPFKRKAVFRRMNSTSIINTSVSDTFILEDRAAFDVEIISGIRYPKFIPILEPNNQFHPISSEDKLFPLCWIDVQAWYDGWRKLRYQAELDPPEIEDCEGKSEEMLFTDIKQSLSDSMLHDYDVKSGMCLPLFQQKNNTDAHFRWKENGINIRKADFEKRFNYDKSDKHSVLVARRDRPHARSSRQQRFEFIYKNHPLAERFCRINLDHFRLVAKLADEKFCTKRQYFNLNEKPYTELFIEAKGGRYSNISLCHLKTEMAHACLKSFFFPCQDVANVMWIKDIGARILQNIFINECNVYDIFQRSVRAADITKFQAVIFLSQGAAILLKHRHICFLDTLSVCLGMEKENVLLIDVGYKPVDINRFYYFYY